MVADTRQLNNEDDDKDEDDYEPNLVLQNFSCRQNFWHQLIQSYRIRRIFKW